MLTRNTIISAGSEASLSEEITRFKKKYKVLSVLEFKNNRNVTSHNQEPYIEYCATIVYQIEAPNRKKNTFGLGKD